MLARFQHDMDVNGVVRSFPAGLRATPETVPIQVGVLGDHGKVILAGKDDIWLPGAWKEYLTAINPPKGGEQVLFPSAGWLNTNEKADTLGFGGNLVEILRVVGVYAQVKCFDVNSLPPDPQTVNYQSGDPRIQKWTMVRGDGRILNPGKSSDLYSFLIARKDMWVHISRLEFFPVLPMQVKISPAAWRGLYVRSTPERRSNNVVSVVGPWSFSHPVTLLEYAPRASSVWARARLADGKLGYISILWYPAPSQMNYYTSWKMHTVPPLPPIA